MAPKQSSSSQFHVRASDRLTLAEHTSQIRARSDLGARAGHGGDGVIKCPSCYFDYLFAKTDGGSFKKDIFADSGTSCYEGTPGFSRGA